MLSQKTIAIAKATAPVFRKHGESLTRHFYKRMFFYNPEDPPFYNPQVTGLLQKTLAGAIRVYARHVNRLDSMHGAVELNAHKHVYLKVKPKHYPIVGENLLYSIKAVLGDTATNEVIDAWAETYGFLVNNLISSETQIIEYQEFKPGCQIVFTHAARN